jgi:GT2 family glycosyltransferase
VKSIKIVFLVVLYSEKVSTSISLNTLELSLQSYSPNDYVTLVIDNSSNEVASYNISDHQIYFSFGENIGLARAYNEALCFCKENGAVSLIVLDEDSTISEQYLRLLDGAVNSWKNNMAAYVPRVMSHSRVISPFHFNFLALPKYGFRKDKFNYAINSFTIFNVECLDKIGGFESHYWLDALDLSTFDKIRKAGYSVSYLPVDVVHNLSLLGKSIKIERLRNIFHFESCYLAEYHKGLRLAMGLFRLVARGCKIAYKSQKISVLLLCLQSMRRGFYEGRLRVSRSD